MRRFLIVGCGGSGGATIRFIQDQLLADLRPEGTNELPDGWQFVHIDVPTSPDNGPAPLGSVRDMGGRYLSVSSVGNSYERAAAQLFHKLGSRLDLALNWAPDPHGSTPLPPVENGAGQYRAVGRVLTLTRLEDLQAVLGQAYEDLQKPDPWNGLSAERKAKAKRDSGVIPLVIGSMAGGSGASMFLDVCRVLGRFIEPKNIGAFLYTSDVFRTLGDDFRRNIEGNALGAMGDVIAAQMGSSAESDSELLATLGVRDVRREAFARVFPIGARLGGDGAVFGDGTPMGIFRGMGRAIAALINSDVQDSYVDFILGNPNDPTLSTDVFGWGSNPKEIAWGSFGYSSLSLGRERYVEYSAQRLARSAADRLMTGHMDPGNLAPSGEQLKAKVDAQWALALARLGLPGVGEDVIAWFKTRAMTPEFVSAESRRAVNDVLSMVNGTEASAASDWFGAVQSRLPHYREPVRQGLDKAAYRWTERFGEVLESQVVEEFLGDTKRLGLPYARQILIDLQSHLDTMVNVLQGAPDPNGFDPLELNPTLASRVQAMKKAIISAGHELTTLISGDIAKSSGRVLQTAGARYTAKLLDSFKTDVLAPLIKAASHALSELEASRDSSEVQAGLAQLRSDVYREWPDNSSHVPERFSHAENEILLTTSSGFPALFEEHVTRTSGGGRPYADSLADLVGQVIRGQWETQGGAPGDIPIAHRRASWRAGVLLVDSESGQPTPRSAAAYSLDFSPAQVLDRARLFLDRPGEPFAVYRSESVGDYLNDTSLSVPELESRKTEFAGKFLEAMRLARPLVGVSPPMVQALHGEPMRYNYIFSGVGLPADDAAIVAIDRQLEADRNSLDDAVRTNLKKACSDSATESRIAFFGFYPKYSPLVYTSLLAPVQSRFDSIPDSNRAALWRWKSTRPLGASLPMSSRELEAIVGGWYVGLLTGQVRTGGADQPSAVWDTEKARWLALPWPLLSEPALPMDRLAITLEAYLLAFVNSEGQEGSAGQPELAPLQPYRALRRIWDSTINVPIESSMRGSLAAKQTIQAWLRDGAIQGADRSAAVPDAAEISADERRTAALKWVGEVSDVIDGLIIDGAGAEYGRKLPRVDGAGDLFARPRLTTLAPQIARILSEIKDFLDSPAPGQSGPVM